MPDDAPRNWTALVRGFAAATAVSLLFAGTNPTARWGVDWADRFNNFAFTFRTLICGPLHLLGHRGPPYLPLVYGLALASLICIPAYSIRPSGPTAAVTFVGWALWIFLGWAFWLERVYAT